MFAHLANAVGFVDYKQGHLDALQGVHETLVVEPLRRNVQQGDGASTNLRRSNEVAKQNFVLARGKRETKQTMQQLANPVHRKIHVVRVQKM